MILKLIQKSGEKMKKKVSSTLLHLPPSQATPQNHSKFHFFQLHHNESNKFFLLLFPLIDFDYLHFLQLVSFDGFLLFRPLPFLVLKWFIFFLYYGHFFDFLKCSSVARLPFPEERRIIDRLFFGCFSYENHRKFFLCYNFLPRLPQPTNTNFLTVEFFELLTSWDSL